jgi:hypothetical protein
MHLLNILSDVIKSNLNIKLSTKQATEILAQINNGNKDNENTKQNDTQVIIMTSA